MISLAKVGTRKRNPIYNRGNKTKFFSFMQIKLPSIGFIFFSTKIPIPCLDIVNNCITLPHRSRRQGSWVGDDIMEKAFTWRFVLMLLNFATSMSIKNKATVNVSWVCFSYSFIILVVMISIIQGAYYISAWGFALLVSIDRAMRRPRSMERATSDWLHAFLFILKSATIIQYTIKGRFMSR